VLPAILDLDLESGRQTPNMGIYVGERLLSRLYSQTKLVLDLATPEG